MTEAVILCPGQGAQSVGMGKSWIDAHPVAAATFEEADAVLGDSLGAPLSRICLEGPEDRVNRTDVSQPAIYTSSIACMRALAADGEGLVPGVAAGLSLGEYTALHLAGAFEFADGLRLVAARGRLMQQAAEASRGSMVAIIGAADEEAEALAEDAGGDEVLVCANFNAPGQIVLSGDEAACDRAVDLAGERGFRATKLSVAGAFHSDLMRPAADEMARILETTELSPLRIDVWSNVTAEPHERENMELLRQRLVEQITSPVRWAQSCRDLVSRWEIGYHELAPGSVLRGLMRRIDRKVKVKNHDRPQDVTSAR